MAKKAKKRRPGGGRPQPGKRVTPKGATGAAEPAAASAKDGAQPAKAQAGKAHAGKAQAGMAQAGMAQPAKPQATKVPSGKPQSGKAQRIEAARRARRRKSLAIRLGVAGIAGILVALLVVRALAGRGDEAATRAQLTAGSCDYDTKADRTDPAPRNHVASPTYQVDPPAGGNHTAQAATPATYPEGRIPTDGQVVHAMEHGDVVLWYRPGLSAEDMGTLQKVSDTYEKDVLVVPRATLSTAVAATAWGRRLLCGSVEPDALDLFTRTYRDKGPEKLPEE